MKQTPCRGRWIQGTCGLGRMQEWGGASRVGEKGRTVHEAAAARSGRVGGWEHTSPENMPLATCEVVRV